jgi:hypothetical protein
MSEADMTDLVPNIDKPTGIPVLYADYVKLMFDLQILAFQTDSTRIVTMMMGREGSMRTYPEIGVPDPHHPLTHHRGNAEWIERVTQVNVMHMELFANFVQKMKETPDGDGSLLDHSMIVYGSGLSDGNRHTHEDLPVLLVGRGGGFRTGQHIAYESPHADDEPVPDAARPHGRAGRADRRQHGPHRAPDAGQLDDGGARSLRLRAPDGIPDPSSLIPNPHPRSPSPSLFLITARSPPSHRLFPFPFSLCPLFALCPLPFALCFALFQVC